MARREGDNQDGKGPRGITRRRFLETSAATAAGAVLAGCSGGEQAGPDAGEETDARTDDPDAFPRPDAAPPPDAAPIDPPDSVPTSTNFGLGVASGDVLRQQAILWTRYDGSADLTLGVWEMNGGSYVRTVFEGPVTPGDGGFVHVDVDGLAAGARHRYAFFETSGGERTARSEIGTFRAALTSADVRPLKLAASSCANNGRAMKTMEHAGARDDIDLFMLLGDTVYADNSETPADYRAKWAENLSTDGFRAMRASTSVLATWDDHEVDNDFNPESIDSAVLRAATDAFFEHQPLRRDATNPDRIWKSFRWGFTAEIFVLDCRGERKPSTRTSNDPIYLSRAQMDWLKAGLMNSPAVFKIIMNSVPISDFPTVFDAAANDRWEGYAEQRTEILSHIDDNSVTGVLWLAGDFHMASVGRVDTSGPGSTQVEALCGPIDQFGNPLAAIVGGSQFDWSTAASNYTTIALDPANVQATLAWIDGDGEILHQATYDL